MKPFFLLVSLLLSPAFAEEIEMEFHVYEVEPVIGNALEDRLIAGGEGALAAMEKLPDFIRQGRITELDSLAFTTASGERTIKKSKGSLITLPTREAVKGLEVEIDLVLERGVIDCNLFAAFTTEDKGDPVERTVTTQTQGRIGFPMLLCRWQREDERLLLVGKASLAGEAGTEGGSAAGNPGEVIYIESAYYPSATSASSGRDVLASTRIPCRSGQQSRSEIIGWIEDENILQDDNPGFRSLLNPVSNEDGTISLRATCGYIVESGGRTRLESGERVRRLEIRSASDTLEMKENELAGRKAELARLEDVEAKEDNYVAAFRFTRASSR